jgi:hypothetical protein
MTRSMNCFKPVRFIQDIIGKNLLDLYLAEKS